MGIDLGTSSLKVVVIDETGVIKAKSARDYDFASPQNGYAEQNPQDWWDACCKAILEALARLGEPPSRIKSVSFSGQMHGAVFLDQNQESIRPAILHCDARSGPQVEKVKELLGLDFIRKSVLNPIYTGFMLPSLLWLMENEPANYSKIRSVLLPKDYLKLKLSGVLCSDYSDASATLLFDLRQTAWSQDIRTRLGLPEEILPPCFGTTAPIGVVSKRAANATGLKEGTLVVNGGADQVMQAIGSGAVLPGMATVNIGSSGQVCFQSDNLISNPSLNTNTFCGYQLGHWITMGATMSAGLSLKWFNSLFETIDYEHLNSQVAKISPGSGGLLFLPYLTGERTPHLNPDLSGMFLGMTTETNRYQMTRAVMEGVAYSLRQALETCGELGLQAEELIASGGGARSKPWLQLQADIYGTPIKVATFEQQASLGAAITAGVGAGVYPSVASACQQVIEYREERYYPNPSARAMYTDYYQLFLDVYEASKTVLERTTRLGRGTRS